MKTTVVAGQPSWRLRSKTVDAWLTRTGGHLAPVTFRLGRRTVQPYLVAPWHGEKMPRGIKPVIRVLRGDFFCLPFGKDGPPYFKGERHLLHGPAANADWRRAAAERSGNKLTFRVEMPLGIRRGQIEKQLVLIDGHSAVYNRHLISDTTGPLTFAHHPCLALEGTSAIISTSPILFGQVLPGGRAGDRSSLKAGTFFERLSKVPLARGGYTDLSRYPARDDNEDMVQIAARATGPFAWSAVTVAERGYVWFTLKDPRVLPATAFWFSNGGVDAPPLNGNLRGVLGVEDLCSYFGAGVAGSLRRNSFSSRGCPTVRSLARGEILDVRTISGVAAIPADFGRVARIVARTGAITLVSAKGREVECELDHEFLTRVLPAAGRD